MFNTVAFTGERLRLTPPNSLQNATYIVEITVPLIRCSKSDDRIKTLTATAAYRHALAGLDEIGKSNDTLFHPENLTFISNSQGIVGSIGYYAAFQYDILYNLEGSSDSMVHELWIAMGHSREGKKTVHHPEPDDARYYRYGIRNASITTKVAFLGNAQLLHASSIEETDFTLHSGILEEGRDSVLFAEDNYDSFASILLSILEGFVLKTEWEMPGIRGWNWTTSVDQTVLGTAKDFSVITEHWKHQGLELSETVQDKNLTTLIEEFSLNASWSLMGLPGFT
jgi:hypothetical protein